MAINTENNHEEQIRTGERPAESRAKRPDGLLYESNYTTNYG